MLLLPPGGSSFLLHPRQLMFSQRIEPIHIFLVRSTQEEVPAVSRFPSQKNYSIDFLRAIREDQNVITMRLLYLICDMKKFGEVWAYTKK